MNKGCGTLCMVIWLLILLFFAVNFPSTNNNEEVRISPNNKEEEQGYEHRARGGLYYRIPF